ncbi:MAG: inositol monophosphatase [Halothiobacillus sp. 13-55-115]|nr:MAG: inositol monophosphatase [Halothiobacillus sp. 13-55-115]
MLTMAVRAARAAGTVISRATDHVADLTIESKQRNDFVSEVDRQAEHAIIDILKRAYPDHQIYNPSNLELYTAERGGGAFLNNRRIRVAGLRNLEGALLGTGFPFRPEQDLETYLKTFRALHGPLAGIRRAGSAALDLAYVAAGRLDGYWEFGLRPWDIAAGVLMVREAGGVVVDFSGKEEFMTSGNLIAANPKITHAMLKAISQSLL